MTNDQFTLFTLSFLEAKIRCLLQDRQRLNKKFKTLKFPSPEFSAQEQRIDTLDIEISLTRDLYHKLQNTQNTTQK